MNPVATGWACPRCHAVYAPHVCTCGPCSSRVVDGSDPVRIQVEAACRQVGTTFTALFGDPARSPITDKLVRGLGDSLTTLRRRVFVLVWRDGAGPPISAIAEACGTDYSAVAYHLRRWKRSEAHRTAHKSP